MILDPKVIIDDVIEISPISFKEMEAIDDDFKETIDLFMTEETLLELTNN
jgi:hypothetical protein